MRPHARWTAPLRYVFAAALLLLAPGTCQRPRQPPVRDQEKAQPDPLGTKPPGPTRAAPNGAGAVRQATTADLIKGPRATARPGDWLVSNDRLRALFRASDGALADLAFPGAQDRHHRMVTIVSDTRGRYPVQYRRFEVVERRPGSGPALRMTGRVRDSDLDLEVTTTVHAPPGASYLVLSTLVRNRDKRRVLALGIGDRAYFFNTRSFVPGVGLVRESWKGHAHFVTQTEGEAVAGLVTGEKAPMGLDLSLESEAFNPDLITRYRSAHLAPGATLRARRFVLFHRGQPASASDVVQRLLGGALATVALWAAPAAGRELPLPEVEILRQGLPVLRSPLAAPTQVTLPAGQTYEARLLLPGAGAGAAVPLGRLEAGPSPPRTLPWPAHGRILYRVVDEAGRPMPARLTLWGRGQTPTPELGDDGTVEGAANAIYTATGAGARVLAPGRYLVQVTRGLEYALHEAEVAVEPGRDTTLSVTLARELHTPGAVSADLHLHAAPSPDSDVSLEARLVQLAAVGVEYGVATDHNHVTDYAPALPRLGLSRHLMTDVGVELTTRRALWGHFNLFPLPSGSRKPPYWNRTPREMFDHAHALPTRPVVQVNHPRMGSIGYFDQVDLDPRHGRAFGPGFETDFHALEVYNGDWVYRPERVERNLLDWFALLNQGHRFTATGNSDAHKLGYQEAGYPRSFLLVAPHPDDPEALRRAAGESSAASVGSAVGVGSAAPHPLVEAIRSQRVIVSAGPYPTIALPEEGGGERLVVGHTLRGPQTLRLAVHAACWVPVHEVALVANGVTIKTWTLPRPLPRPMPRPLPPKGGRCESRRFTETLRLTPPRDTWYLLVARGKDPLPVLRGRATAVIGFTNPVWIDADGDGRFDAPGLPPPPPTR